MSSGNLTADRRFAYGRQLQEAGDPAAAADLFAQALELAPDWAEGRFARAEALVQAGDHAAARTAFADYLRCDPADSMGAAVQLALLAADTPSALPQAYVTRLFDQYAPRFDRSLRDGLHYRAPESLHAAVTALAPGHRFADTLDLGCGTGLAGAVFRPLTNRLEGVDLSAAMVAEAARKNIYDALSVGELIAYLRAAPRPFDLLIAADVLVYLGDLAPLMAAAAAAVPAGGLFAFTVQRHNDTGYALGPDQRFRHSAAYLKAAAAPFAVVYLAEGVFRQEKGIDVPGLLTVLRR